MRRLAVTSPADKRWRLDRREEPEADLRRQIRGKPQNEHPRSEPNGSARHQAMQALRRRACEDVSIEYGVIRYRGVGVAPAR